MLQRRYNLALAQVTGANANNLKDIALFLTGALLVGTAANSVFGILVDFWGDSLWSLTLFFSASFVALAFLAFPFSRFLRDRLRRLKGPPLEDDNFAPYPALVMLISEGANTLADRTLERHLEAQVLRTCWLVCTPQSEQQGERLIKEFGATNDVQFHISKVQNRVSFRPTYDAVRAAIDAARKEGCALSEILVDVTGGSKIMSIGAAFASAERQLVIEYVDATDPETRTRLPPELTKYLRIDLSDGREDPLEELTVTTPAKQTAAL